MRRLLFVLSLLFCSIVACGRQPTNQDGEKPQAKATPPAQLVSGSKDPAKEPGSADPKEAWQPAGEDKRAQYESALTEALNLLADQKWPEALVALETAQTFQ